MAKTGKKSYNDDRLRYYHLHRECVRRNPEYIEKFAKLNLGKKASNAWDVLGARSHWGLWSNDTLPDPKKRPDLEKIKKLKASETIYLPGDIQYDQAGEMATNAALRFMQDIPDEDYQKSLKGMMLLIYFPEASPDLWQMSAIDSRLSKKDMIEILSRFADVIISERRKSGLKQVKPSERLRVEHGFDYLRAYDLRKAGNSFREVAKKMWPGQSGDLERKARLYCNKAEALIKEPPICEIIQKQFEARKERKRILRLQNLG